MAEKFRSSILGAPGEFRDSSFDPDRASLDELRGRSGEIAKLMAPAPRELEFSDTGMVRDVFRLPSDIFDPGMPPTFGDDSWGSPPSGDPDIPPWAIIGKDPNDSPVFGPGSGGMFPGSGGPGSSGMGGTPPTSIHDMGEMGKDVTTGRILREHPDKFKHEGDPMEPGGRFFDRVPAILRRIDPMTARSRGATGEDYGKPGGYKFLNEEDYWGKSESDPYFMGI
tara:strand:- start:66 stop:737 length:672 start_codon:yes stop_codon:yes gene_type:complete